jgi:acetoacetate decarboxylase
MAFVKTTAEIAAIEQVLQTPRFTNARRAYLSFLTTAEFIEQVLPPGLSPGAAPMVTVTIGEFGSNCVGDFAGATISMPARYGEVEAAYVLTMFMSTDHAIIFGRDLFGEPKKQAAIELKMTGNQLHGTVDRMGVRLIDLSLSLGEDSGPSRSQAATFNIKAQPSVDGHGLEADAVLTIAEFDNDLRLNRSAQGTLILAGTVHDPLHEIPIREIAAAGYVEGDLNARARAIGTIPAAEFLPYAHGRLDYWPALDTSGQAGAEAAE